MGNAHDTAIEREIADNEPRTPLYGYTSAETAYVVDDYPYGRRLRCKIRYWLEFKPSHGFRLVSQTTNPTRPGETWNKPHPGGYTLIGACMYLDSNGHVKWDGLSEYSSAEDVARFVETYPGAEMARVKRWVRDKITYVKACIDGKAVFTINKVPQPWTDADLERFRHELTIWEGITFPES